MKSIATNQVKGFPDGSTVRTVYIQEEVVKSRLRLM